MTETQSTDTAGTTATTGLRHVTGRMPKSVAIIALGPTSADWHAGNMSYDRAFGKPDEVWTLNKGIRTIRSDVVFIMDDLVGEAARSPQYAQDIADVREPIITSIVDERVRAMFPALSLYRYPLDHVFTHLGARLLLQQGWTLDRALEKREEVFELGRGVGMYIHNSIPYMLAYALFIGVEQVALFGADYTFPGQNAREDDRANAEYWVGVLRAFGVDVKVPSTTTLLNMRQQKGLYGFGQRQPVLAPPQPEDIEREWRFLTEGK